MIGTGVGASSSATTGTGTGSANSTTGMVTRGTAAEFAAGSASGTRTTVESAGKTMVSDSTSSSSAATTLTSCCFFSFG